MDEIGMLGRYNSMLTKVNDLLVLTERQEKQKRESGAALAGGTS